MAVPAVGVEADTVPVLDLPGYTVVVPLLVRLSAKALPHVHSSTILVSVGSVQAVPVPVLDLAGLAVVAPLLVGVVGVALDHVNVPTVAVAIPGVETDTVAILDQFVIGALVAADFVAINIVAYLARAAVCRTNPTVCIVAACNVVVALLGASGAGVEDVGLPVGAALPRSWQGYFTRALHVCLLVAGCHAIPVRDFGADPSERIACASTLCPTAQTSVHFNRIARVVR